MKIIKSIIIAAIIFLLAFKGFAQQKSVAMTWQFHSINNIGLLEGQAGAAMPLQTINGLQNKSWVVGAGVGLDDSRFRTLPLFVDIRKEFGTTQSKFFLYADAGT